MVEGPLCNLLHDLQYADGDQLAEGENGLAVLGHPRQGVVYLAVEFGDKIGDVYGVPSLWRVVNSQHKGTSWHFQNQLKHESSRIWRSVGEGRGMG